MTKESPLPATPPATEADSSAFAAALAAVTTKHDYPLHILTRSAIKALLPGLEKMAADTDPYISQIAHRIIDKHHATVKQGTISNMFAEVRLTPKITGYLEPYLESYLTKLDQRLSARNAALEEQPPDSTIPHRARHTGRTTTPHTPQLT